MTTASENLALRAIVVLSETANPQKTPTVRLLRDLGHDVHVAQSPDDTLHLLDSSGVDLMVVDLASAEQTRRFFDNLSTIPPEQRPRHIAVFSDALDEYARHLNRTDRGRVHVFLKPLHVHGLLSVLRNLEGRIQQSA